jgi:hypothetical protein
MHYRVLIYETSQTPSGARDELTSTRWREDELHVELCGDGSRYWQSIN